VADEAGRLREWLAERDEACPACGYNLRGLAGEATGSLIAAIVGLAVGLGGSGLFAIILLIGLLRYSSWEADLGTIGCMTTPL